MNLLLAIFLRTILSFISIFVFAGIQHAAPEMKELVKKMRNPFMHPGFVISTAVRQIRDRTDYPSLKQDLAVGCSYLLILSQDPIQAITYYGN